MPGMTDRDHFAAAALTGLLAGRKFTALDDAIVAEAYAEAAYGIADAILRERCRATADYPPPDNAPNHDAAPAARADLPDERPPHAVSASGGTPSAASRDGSGTGDTPKPISGCVSDRSKPIASEQEPVAWGVASHLRVLATSISRADAVDMQSDYAYHTEIVPLYRHPPCQDFLPKNLTLTDAEREAVERASIAYELLPTEGAQQVSATLRGLLERLGGGR